MLDHHRAMATSKAVEREGHHVGMAAPGWRELGPEGNHEQDRQALDPIDDEPKPLSRGRVDPMGILKDH